MLGRSILAPIFGVEFKFQWFVDVLISFRQPLRDIMYTFTYYFIDHTVVYRNTIMYETIAGLILFSIRILQNSRAMYQNRKFGGVPLWGITRSLLNSITMITSYLSRTNDNGQNFYLYFWLVIALITTLFSYYVDLRNDWAFLDPNHGYLRAKLLYRNKKFYYFVIVLNLLLRFVWTMNISPDIIRRLPVKPYIVVMVLSCLQITRRCIWMIFRVQRQHINAQQQLDNLFILEKHSQIELQFIEQQKQITIKSPNWLKISIDPQEEIKKSRLADFRLENEQNMLNLEKKLQRAENIINILTTEPQKCCGKSQN